MNDYISWGVSELIEELQKRDRTHNWLISEAWRLLELREDSDAENWRGYAAQHAKDALEQWASEIVSL